VILVVAEGEAEAVLIIDGFIAAAEHAESCDGRLADALGDQLAIATRPPAAACSRATGPGRP
jgi:hypothetical protein